jgi:DHA1 family multidrug resistance protein-like MFS transporter
MGRWRKQFSFLLIVQFTVMTAHGMFIPILPAYLIEIGGLNSHQLLVWSGFIFGANFLSMMIAMPLLGKIGDRYGQKPVMIWSGFGMVIVTFLMFFAQHPFDLVILRFIQGCFTGILPFTMVLVVLGSPKEKVGISVGTLQMAGELGSVVGPLLGGALLIFLHAKSVLPMMSIFILIGSLCVLWFIREPERTVHVLPKQNIIEDWRQVWQTRPFQQLLISAFCINFALVGTSPIIHFYIKQSTHLIWSEALSIGIAIAATSLAVILFSPLLGKLADRIGPLPLLKIATCAAALLGFTQMYVHSYLTILICRFLLGLCVAAMIPNIQAQIRRYMKPGMESRTFMISNSWMFMGSLVGPLLSGEITAILGINGWFGVTGCIFAISCWQAFRIGQMTYSKNPSYNPS